MKTTQYSPFGLLAASVSLLSLPALATTAEQDTFFDSIAAHCGQAFEGSITAGNSADSAFSGKSLIMHVLCGVTY